MPPAYGPRDELTGPTLPPAWRALLLPSLVRGLTSGLTMGLALLPFAVLMEIQRGTMRPHVLLVVVVVFGVAVGLLGGAPAAALEARARARSDGFALTAVLCGGLVSLAGVLLVGQVFYLKGVALGGVGAGLDEVATRLVRPFLDAPARAVGITAGIAVGLAWPFAVAVALRLRGRSVPRQVGWGLFSQVLVVVASCIPLGALTAWLGLGKKPPPPVDPLVAHPIAGGAFAFVAALLCTLVLLGLTLALLLPPALALADRLAARWTPLPEPAA